MVYLALTSSHTCDQPLKLCVGQMCVGMRLSRMTMLGFFCLIICGAKDASREVSGVCCVNTMTTM